MWVGEALVLIAAIVAFALLAVAFPPAWDFLISAFSENPIGLAAYTAVFFFVMIVLDHLF
jgi:hypothetical protein